MGPDGGDGAGAGCEHKFVEGVIILKVYAVADMAAIFGHDLEKGVILRGRLRGILVPRAVDVAAAQAHSRRVLFFLLCFHVLRESSAQ